MWRAALTTLATPGFVGRIPGFDTVTVVDVSSPLALALAFEDDDADLLVACHPDHEHATRVACSMLAAHRPGRHIAHVNAPQAPLAALITLGTATDIAADAGHGAAIWRDLSTATWSAVVMSSVAGLDHPNPTVVQHVRSWLPGSRFLVRLGTDPLAVSATKPHAALAGLRRGEYDLLVSGSTADPLVEAISQVVAPRAVLPVALPTSWTAGFARAELYQIALVPDEPTAVLRDRGPTCEGCGWSAVEDVCECCRTRMPTAMEWGR